MKVTCAICGKEINEYDAHSLNISCIRKMGIVQKRQGAKGQMSMYIWMAVTPDEYELPLALEDSSIKLAELLGISASTVRGCEFRDRDGSISGMKFVKVRNTDEDTDTDTD